MKIRCIVIDDNDLYRQTVSDWIQAMPTLDLYQSYKNPLEAQAILVKEEIPLIFLDIEMPQISGIDFAQTLIYNPVIIFITSHTEFAVQGFELDAVDYLVKPFTQVRFIKAVNKALEKIQKSVLKEASAPQPKDNFIFIQTDKQYVKIDFDNIIYIEALKEYIKIKTEEQSLISLIRMKSVMEQLPTEQFLRVHRSFIINIQKVSQINPEEILLGSDTIPIGDSYREEIKEKVMKNNLLKR